MQPKKKKRKKRMTAGNQNQRPRYTHFLAFQVNDPGVVDNIKRYQTKYAERFPKSCLNDCPVLPSRSHLTLKVLAVPIYDTDRLKKVFRETAAKFSEKLRGANITLEHVHSRRFRHGDTLIYVKANPGSFKTAIYDMVTAFHEQFKEEKWQPEDALLDLHCSLFNTKMLPRYAEISEEEIRDIQDNGRRERFGIQAVSSVQLLTFTKEDGYYKVVDEFFFNPQEKHETNEEV